MRNTLNVCRRRGVRNQEAGLRMRKARMLKGGWYEKSAPDLTLR